MTVKAKVHIHLHYKECPCYQERLSLFLTPDKRKHNLYSFLCIKCLHVQIKEVGVSVSLYAGSFGFHPVSNLCG